MAFAFGENNDFTDSNSILVPVIAALAKAVTLPRFKGAVFQAMRAPQIGIKTKQFDIYSRSKNQRTGVIGTAAVGDWGAVGPTTAMPIPASSIAGLAIGHVLKVDSEVVVISAIDKVANTVGLFARGAGGTTAAIHTTSAAFTVIGYAGQATCSRSSRESVASVSAWLVSPV